MFFRKYFDRKRKLTFMEQKWIQILRQKTSLQCVYMRFSTFNSDKNIADFNSCAITFRHSPQHNRCIYHTVERVIPFPGDESPHHVTSHCFETLSTSQTFLTLWPPRFCWKLGNRWRSLGDEFPWCNNSQCRFRSYTRCKFIFWPSLINNTQLTR